MAVSSELDALYRQNLARIREHSEIALVRLEQGLPEHADIAVSCLLSYARDLERIRKLLQAEGGGNF